MHDERFFAVDRVTGKGAVGESSAVLVIDHGHHLHRLDDPYAQHACRHSNAFPDMHGPRWPFYAKTASDLDAPEKNVTTSPLPHVPTHAEQLRDLGTTVPLAAGGPVVELGMRQVRDAS